MTDTTSWPVAAEPEPPRYADDSAEEIEEAAASERATESPLPTDRFLDRLPSWLDFNSRVLTLAADEDVPLLERVRFLAIFSRNLDEFFMVRVAALRSRVAAGISTPSVPGGTPKERLQLISRRGHELVEEQAALFRDVVVPELAEQGVKILRWSQLEPHETARMRELFTERIHPVLTPLAVDPAHPFPYISGLSLNLAVVVRDTEGDGNEHFARVKVPPVLPRFVPTDDTRTRFVPLEAVIAAHLDELFPEVSILEASSFRVTRNEDVELDSDADNVLHALELELSRRRFGAPVRLEVDGDMSERVLDLLVRELEITDQEVYRVPAPLDLAGLWPLAELDRPDLRYADFVPQTHPRLRGIDGSTPDVFAAIRDGDLFVHHPYDSFASSVLEFIEQAANDPQVMAIKLTLYRTSGESEIVDALVDAARAGKQVLVVVEIKARFDEQANIRWARELEKSGCHVVYGLVGLKTHCKLCLVVRSEAGGRLRRYVHVGTGNYHPNTARIYEDIGLLTADAVVGADVADLFNHLSGYTRHREYDTLLVAPDSLRTGLVELIRREVASARAGEAADISIKVNSLVDTAVIDELYAASAAGVRIDLVVRGMCSLRPGIPELSENIRVRSILGRFLEHSRIFRFGNRGDAQFWMGSADIMDRNLDRRVEALVEVSDPEAKRLMQGQLDLAWAPDLDCWTLQSDGTWVRADRETRRVDYQRAFISGQEPDRAVTGAGQG